MNHRLKKNIIHYISNDNVHVKRFGVFEGEQTKTKLFIKNRKTRIESKPESPQEEQKEYARSENEEFLAKKSEFLRRFYFSHFMNNFQNLHSTMKRLGTNYVF